MDGSDVALIVERQLVLQSGQSGMPLMPQVAGFQNAKAALNLALALRPIFYWQEDFEMSSSISKAQEARERVKAIRERFKLNSK